MNCWSHRSRSSRTSHSIDKPLFIRWWTGLFVFTIWSATELKTKYLGEGSHLDPPNIYTMVTPLLVLLWERRYWLSEMRDKHSDGALWFLSSRGRNGLPQITHASASTHLQRRFTFCCFITSSLVLKTGASSTTTPSAISFTFSSSPGSYLQTPLQSLIPQTTRIHSSYTSTLYFTGCCAALWPCSGL